MKVLVNPTPKPPAKEGRDPIDRVTVQFVGDDAESLGICVMPLRFWEEYLEPVLVTGTAQCNLHLVIEDSTA